MKNKSRFKQFQPAVIGVLKDHDNLTDTLNELKKNHFDSKDIALLTAEKEDVKRIPSDSYIIESVLRGLIVGVIEGALFGLLISLNLVPLPGSETFITVGPFISVVAGVSIGLNVGAITGAIMGYLVNRKVSKRYKEFIENKGVIVSIHVDEQDTKKQLKAKNILVNHGAVEVLNPMKFDLRSKINLA